MSFEFGELNHARRILDTSTLQHETHGQKFVMNGLQCGMLRVSEPTLILPQEVSVDLVDKRNRFRLPIEKFVEDVRVLLDGLWRLFPFAWRYR